MCYFIIYFTAFTIGYKVIYKISSQIPKNLTRLIPLRCAMKIAAKQKFMKNKILHWIIFTATFKGINIVNTDAIHSDL